MVKKQIRKKASKKTSMQFRSLGMATTIASAALVVSIFVASSIDMVLVQSQQYASVIAAVLVDLANSDRSTEDLHGLTVNPKLVEAAQLKANDMAAKGYFAHVAPDGTEPWKWFREAGYEYAYAGENLAIDFSDSSAVNDAWMQSPTHRANILGKNFTEIGIATSQGFYQGRPTMFVVQMFGAPMSSGNNVAAVSTNVPTDATEPAVTSGSSVLGESTEATTEPTAAPAESETAQSASMSVRPSVPEATFWQQIAFSPQKTLHITYNLLAIAIVIGLLLFTGFELKQHHATPALAATSLVALIVVLFFTADTFLFTKPQVPTSGVAAVAAAL